ncbi:2-amino-3-ketobutyrate coenzyme A ligase [Klebsiella pneumoniae]|nr:2-amino-3-ketobutyrate coenzyme A ligase [Klebsiella pneumoniae]SVV17549.1 2-amino-3-ketobutyrate coenzyme A ligase [Klebsiella pneumoniae]
MRGDFYKQLTSNLETARAEGLFKEERIITSAQQADITVGDSHVINFCANNYLGLANHPELIAAAKSGMDSHGFGMASVRFICGTQDTHKQLEKKLADFLGSSTPPVSTPTAACLKRCSARKTPLSPTP